MPQTNIAEGQGQVEFFRKEVVVHADFHSGSSGSQPSVAANCGNQFGEYSDLGVRLLSEMWGPLKTWIVGMCDNFT